MNPLLKVIATVAILAASYFFILKPILDTTEGTIDRAFDDSANIQKSVQQSIKQANQQAEQQGAQSVQFESEGLTPKQAGKLLQCVQNAGGDVEQIQGCNEKFAQ